LQKGLPLLRNGMTIPSQEWGLGEVWLLHTINPPFTRNTLKPRAEIYLSLHATSSYDGL